ncbi:hypothetical protein ACVWY2_007490 [Bradyrhizobium sp. JR6.1]
MPRAATSVATQTLDRPSRNACSAWVRSFWVISPDSEATENPRSSSAACKCLTASRVLQNTSALGASWKRSTLTTACSTSSAATRMARYSISAWPPSSPATSIRNACC